MPNKQTGTVKGKSRLEYQREYYQKHKEKMQEYQRLYNLNHKKNTCGPGKGNRRPVMMCPRLARRNVLTSVDLMNKRDKRLFDALDDVVKGKRGFVL